MDKKTLTVYLVAIALLSVGAGYYLRAPASSPVLGSSPNRDVFTSVTIDANTTITTGGVTVVTQAQLAGNPDYVSLVNSGSNGISCFPSATTTNLIYGGGWWLAPAGGALAMDSEAIWGGAITCETGSGTSSLAIVAR